MQITRTFNNTNPQSLSNLVHILTELQINDFISKITNSSPIEEITPNNKEVAA